MKKRVEIMGVAFAAVGMLSLTSSSSPGGSLDASLLSGDAARGRKIYVQKSCVDCHAVMGRGGKIGPDLAQVGKGRSHHRLVAKLWDHLPLMVESFEKEGLRWPMISEEEMADLSAYLFYLNFFDRPGEYEKGKIAFTEKRCITCHRIGGTGADTGPPLDEFAASASPLNMVSRMWSHGIRMVSSQKAQNMEVPKFAGSDVADVLAFLRGASLEPATRAAFLSPGVPERGQTVFEKKQCSMCHAKEGGDEQLGPNLTNLEPRHSVSEYAGILWNHGPMMWDAMLEQGIAIPPFTSEEMTDLLAYLYFLGYYPEDGSSKRGKNLFYERNCDACHAEPGREPRPQDGPPLIELSSVAEPNRFAAALWNHGPAMLERVRDAALRWPGFTESEMRDLTLYLREVHAENAEGAGEDD